MTAGKGGLLNVYYISAGQDAGQNVRPDFPFRAILPHIARRFTPVRTDPLECKTSVYILQSYVT